MPAVSRMGESEMLDGLLGWLSSLDPDLGVVDSVAVLAEGRAIREALALIDDDFFRREWQPRLHWEGVEDNHRLRADNLHKMTSRLREYLCTKRGYPDALLPAVDVDALALEQRRSSAIALLTLVVVAALDGPCHEVFITPLIPDGTKKYDPVATAVMEAYKPFQEWQPNNERSPSQDRSFHVPNDDHCDSEEELGWKLRAEREAAERTKQQLLHSEIIAAEAAHRAEEMEHEISELKARVSELSRTETAYKAAKDELDETRYAVEEASRLAQANELLSHQLAILDGVRLENGLLKDKLAALPPMELELKEAQASLATLKSKLETARAERDIALESGRAGAERADAAEAKLSLAQQAEEAARLEGERLREKLEAAAESGPEELLNPSSIQDELSLSYNFEEAEREAKELRARVQDLEAKEKVLMKELEETKLALAKAARRERMWPIRGLLSGLLVMLVVVSVVGLCILPLPLVYSRRVLLSSPFPLLHLLLRGFEMTTTAGNPPV